MKIVTGAIYLVCLIIISGCASSQAINKNYVNLVDIADGVNAKEAKIMAQKELDAMYERRDYRLTAPDIKTTPEALKYPNFWFVSFGHNWLSPISTDPLAKTYTDLKDAIYLVVISRDRGEIKFSGEWYPKRDATFDWVFDPYAYNANNTMALRPYLPGHPIPNLRGSDEVNLSTP